MQLIDADTDEHLWSETYDRDFVDIFKIESDIAINVAKALAAEFSENERLALNDRPYDTPGAYREHLRSYADSDLALREAASLAISADADNLAAYSMRAYQGAMSFINSDRPAARLGEQQVAQMANSILSDVEHVLAQPAGPDIHLSAHLARALLYTNIWRWMEASADLELAIELSESGGSPQSLANLAWQLALIGRNGEGIGFGEKAVREWPGGAPSYAYMALGYSYLYGNRPAAALEVFRKSVEINPQMAYSRSGMLVSELARTWRRPN